MDVWPGVDRRTFVPLCTHDLVVASVKCLFFYSMSWPSDLSIALYPAPLLFRNVVTLIRLFYKVVCDSCFQDFTVPDYRTHMQDPQGRRRPSLLSEFHPGTERSGFPFVNIMVCTSRQPDVASDNFLFCRPPERRHGYEQQFHSITSQSEHDAMENKRPRMETVAEAHITRTPPTAGGIILPLTHTVQDSLRAAVEVKKVRPVSAPTSANLEVTFGLSCIFVSQVTLFYSCVL